MNGNQSATNPGYSLPCSLSFFLSMNCRARAEAVLQKLSFGESRTSLSSLPNDKDIIVDTEWEPEYNSFEGRSYSFDTQISNANDKSLHWGTMRPIHVVTSEPTLQLCMNEVHSLHPCYSDPEQDSDVHYDFDLATPDGLRSGLSGCSGTTVWSNDHQPVGDLKNMDKPESGCVTSSTSPVRFVDDRGILSNPPSPTEGCELTERARLSDVNLDEVRNLLQNTQLDKFKNVKSAALTSSHRCPKHAMHFIVNSFRKTDNCEFDEDLTHSTLSARCVKSKRRRKRQKRMRLESEPSLEQEESSNSESSQAGESPICYMQLEANEDDDEGNSCLDRTTVPLDEFDSCSHKSAAKTANCKGKERLKANDNYSVYLDGKIQMTDFSYVDIDINDGHITPIENQQQTDLELSADYEHFASRQTPNFANSFLSASEEKCSFLDSSQMIFSEHSGTESELALCQHGCDSVCVCDCVDTLRNTRKVETCRQPMPDFEGQCKVESDDHKEGSRTTLNTMLPPSGKDSGSSSAQNIPQYSEPCERITSKLSRISSDSFTLSSRSPSDDNSNSHSLSNGQSNTDKQHNEDPSDTGVLQKQKNSHVNSTHFISQNGKPCQDAELADDEIETLPEMTTGSGSPLPYDEEDEIITGSIINFSENVYETWEDDDAEVPQDVLDDDPIVGKEERKEGYLQEIPPFSPPVGDKDVRDGEQTNDQGSENGDSDTQTRIKRSSSLKCGKTPPGTPGRKKVVRFVDAMGLDLVDVRTYLDGIPNVPKSAFCDLDLEERVSHCQTQSSCVPLKRIISPMFQQPGSLPDFIDRVRSQKVCLENVEIGADLAIKGVIRVLNIDYHKCLYVRYTYDNWRNFHETVASYIEGTSDGFSDRFYFFLLGSFLQTNGVLTFCIKYCTKGQEFWDNNRGTNYILQCYPAPPNTSHIEGRLEGRSQNHTNLQTHPRRASDYNSFSDVPSTPTDPWTTRFF